jgi:hypothetical protein
MNAMGYPQQYPGAQAPSFNTQIIRRPLTDAERELPGRFYKTIQNGLRGLSLFCLILFILNTYVLSSVITDPITYDSLSTVLLVFMGVFGLVAIGMSVNAIVVRNRLVQAMRDGTAVEVFAPAYRSNTRGKVQTWTIGPISMMPTRGLEGLMMEGQPTSVLCLPKLKAAIAINNYGLKQGAKIMCPPNLEMMAVPVGMPAMPTPGPIPSSAYPAYGGPMQQAQTPLTPLEEDLPPPPPD